MTFEELVYRLQSSYGEDRKPFEGKVLTYDPGETTGVAVFSGPRLIYTDQIKTPDLSRESWLNLATYIDMYRPDIVICEDYRVYGWKTDQHTWAHLHTPKLIGMLTAVCYQHGIPMPIMQMAVQAKQFCTDKKLREWDMYDRGLRHGRDAVRHGAYYLLFHKQEWPKVKGRSNGQI